jgi:hypothetical protein
MAVVLIEGVLDNYPSGTLVRACYDWSAFLTPKGGSP